MRIKNIEKTYSGEWVLLDDLRHSKRTGEITSGRVIAHSVDCDEVYTAGLTSDSKHLAVLCFKALDPGTVLVL